MKNYKLIYLAFFIFLLFLFFAANYKNLALSQIDIGLGDGNTSGQTCGSGCECKNGKPSGACEALICCLNNSSSSGSIQRCKCSKGKKWNGNKCVIKTGREVCTAIFAPVCGCDGQTYSSSCIANTEGIISFSDGECSSSSGTTGCNIDDDCPIGICPDNSTYMAFSCIEGLCSELIFIRDPCSDLSTHINSNFTGIWKGKAFICNSGEELVSSSQITAPTEECIICPQVAILCAIGFELIPQTCNECAHCTKCKNTKGIILKLCSSEDELTGEITIPGLINKGKIISTEKISNSELRILIEDNNGKQQNINLSLSNQRQLSGSLDGGIKFQAKKISSIINCKKFNCTDCASVKCADPGEIKRGCKLIRTLLPNGCRSCCKELICSSSSSGEIICPIPGCAAPPEGCSYENDETLGEDGCPVFPCGKLVCTSSGSFTSNCSSQGNCRGENGEELTCPSGTVCSGIPAFGCFPPECPVPICFSPDTQIKTDKADINISDLSVGDIVLTDNKTPVKIKKTGQIKVKNHKILEVKLNDATVLKVSPGHPTGDGRKFEDLMMGDILDERVIVESKLIDYKFSHTYDILPDSKTGNYYANGVLVGSTLK